MALYVILATLTEAGARDIDGIMQRRAEGIQELERHGVKRVADYALMGGDYDFLYIVEADSNETILQQVVRDTRSGKLRFHTMPALSLDAFANLVHHQ